MQLAHTVPAPRFVDIGPRSRAVAAEAGSGRSRSRSWPSRRSRRLRARLYGLCARQDHLAPLTLTVVYAVYVTGVTTSLLLAGHVSDWCRT